MSQEGLALLYKELIRKLNRKFNTKPVVIIDEYDMPIISHFNDLATAKEMMKELKHFYWGVKNTENVHLLFLTGISNYSFFIRFCFFDPIFNLTFFFLLKIILNVIKITIFFFDNIFY